MGHALTTSAPRRLYHQYSTPETHSHRASCFENVTSVIFLASLSDYNSGIIEDLNSNGMQEALMLWASIVNSQCEHS